jgi:hypothetical protein
MSVSPFLGDARNDTVATIVLAGFGRDRPASAVCQLHDSVLGNSTYRPGHLLFAAETTGCIFLSIFFEWRDLVMAFAAKYPHYRTVVPMVLALMRLSQEQPIKCCQ